MSTPTQFHRCAWKDCMDIYPPMTNTVEGTPPVGVGEILVFAVSAKTGTRRKVVQQVTICSLLSSCRKIGKKFKPHASKNLELGKSSHAVVLLATGSQPVAASLPLRNVSTDLTGDRTVCVRDLYTGKELQPLSGSSASLEASLLVQKVPSYLPRARTGSLSSRAQALRTPVRGHHRGCGTPQAAQCPCGERHTQCRGLLAA